jgi:hypothetical protein
LLNSDPFVPPQQARDAYVLESIERYATRVLEYIERYATSVLESIERYATRVPTLIDVFNDAFTSSVEVCTLTDKMIGE